MSNPTDIHALVDKIVAESNASDEALAKGTDITAIVARLRMAIMPSVLHAIASEGEMATDPQMFAEAGECFLATVAGSLAGYLGGSTGSAQFNAARMLHEASHVVMQTPAEVHGVAIERPKRGTAQ